MDPLALEVAAFSRQKAMNEAIAKGNSSVQQFYSDSVVLVTGGSGFLGKLLCEKLLRACPNLKKIYVLLREKKGLSIESRLSEVLKNPVFDIIRKKNPKVLDKLVPIHGDVTEIGLGIKEKDRRTLVKEVNVIFNAAATTRFDTALKLATMCNVRGTREMLTLAKECQKLRSIVHVSTAYCHAREDTIGSELLEKFYPAAITPESLIGLVESLDERKLEHITPMLIKGWFNTYTFTKAVAEHLIREVSGQLPVCLIRPSIVISTYSEPAPGWLDRSCAFSATGILLGPGLGVIHCIVADDNIKIDLIPADIVNNATIVAAQETARRWDAGDTQTKIYNSSNYRNSVKWDYLTKVGFNDLSKMPSPKTLYYCGLFQTKYLPVAYVLYWILHFIPGYFVDGILYIIGMQPIVNKIYTTAWKITCVLSYFTKNTWHFVDNNTKELYENLSQDDKDIFNFNTTTYTWREMMLIWGIGIRKYLIKDELKGTDIGLKKFFWFKILNYFVIVPLYVYLWWIFFTILYWSVNLIIGFLY